ncbi:hypothetical protein BG011_006721 [Mortierella polycephala]|uniref:DUF7707 domain-containing protein n=1 Tax=Mortierella polycephala TaxID=41804 RepID=A0A9P6PV97_9FUNG|nr:hypothetical protein BG011_006721 [Mortierella polycephala]
MGKKKTMNVEYEILDKYEKGNSRVSDVETLTWSCICAGGQAKLFNNWQFPIPFKLCRQDLWKCFQTCPSAITERDISQPKQATKQQQQSRMSIQNTNSNDNSELDYDQDDYDAIEEIQALQYHPKLEDASYLRFKRDVDKYQLLSLKRKQLHKQLWAQQQDGIMMKQGVPKVKSKSEKVKKTKKKSKKHDSGVMYKRSHTAFITMSVAHRDPTCVSSCESRFSCGEESAPEYHGIIQVYSQDGKAPVTQDSAEKTSAE